MDLYCDGSSTGRGNREGGWGWCLVKDGGVIAFDFGGSASASNNTMELEAAIQGLCYLINNNIKEEVTLISDSQYCLRIADGTYLPQKNLEPCHLLRKLFIYTKAEAKWVRGHSGNIGNEICDRLAKQGKEKYVKIKSS